MSDDETYADEKPMTPEKNHGYEAEDIVEEVCKTIFLAEFTVRSPKFYKAAGLEKEAADFVVPADEVLIAFQVKSRKGEVEPNVTDKNYLSRITKRVEKGIDQLQTINKALNAGRITNLTNRSGVTLDFDANRVKRIIGVVVFDLPDEDKLSDREFGPDPPWRIRAIELNSLRSSRWRGADFVENSFAVPMQLPRV